MATRPEAGSPPDRYEIDLWPDRTMAEKCAQITERIGEGHQLRDVVFYHAGGKVHAKCNLVRSTPDA